MKTKRTFITAALATALLLMAYSCMISIGGGTSTTIGTETTVSPLATHLISAAQAKLLTEEYTKKNYKLVNLNQNNPETKEVYYDIEVLQDYINYVRAEAKKKKIKNVGITIAFGQYPNHQNFDNRLKKEYQGKQTVFLKATSKFLPGTGKVGQGGYTPDDGPGVEEISAFDFGQLTPPN